MISQFGNTTGRRRIRMSYQSEVVDPGDRASQLAKEICFTSHGNCQAVEIIPVQPGNFRGAVDFNYRQHILMHMMQKKMSNAVQNDGAGGKPQFFILVGTIDAFGQLGWEIITMCADDLARTGGFPTVMVNQVDAKRVTEKNFPFVDALFRGYGEALAKSRLVNITGEFAIMKHSITAFCDDGTDEQLIVTWGGTCLGLSHEDLRIRPEEITPGMDIVGFWERGYRCNGGTAFTNIITKLWGKKPAEIKAYGSRSMDFIRKLTVPSQSYAQTIVRLNGWREDGTPSGNRIKLGGVFHITGGGVWGKFADQLPEGVGADLHSMPKPADVLLEAQQLADHAGMPIPDLDCYGTFHGGCGTLVVCRPEHTETVIREAEADDIPAQKVGHTMPSAEREVVILSQFAEGGLLSSRDRKAA
jgi:phosphoribosylformylglycinamidine cyclo-ligase